MISDIATRSYQGADILDSPTVWEITVTTQWRRRVGVSVKGRPYIYWERVMSRIPDLMLKCVVFLYPSEEAAKSGSSVGGTGFLVSKHNPVLGGSFDYLVTNTHVAHMGDLFMRVNTQDGGVDIVEFLKSSWVDHHSGDDVATTPLELDLSWTVQPLILDDVFGSRHSFEERMIELNVGPGDDVVMIGRLIGHDGKERNLPLARFGNVAMMTGEPVRDGRGSLVEAFLVEMRSLPGFSGSPVFVHIGPGSDRANGKMMPFFSQIIALIGIDTGHTDETHPVIDRRTGQVVNPDWRVRQNSGVAIVSPAWKIDELLNQEELVSHREKVIKQPLEANGESFAASDISSSEDESPFDRFQNLARNVIRVPKAEVDALRDQS